MPSIKGGWSLPDRGHRGLSVMETSSSRGRGKQKKHSLRKRATGDAEQKEREVLPLRGKEHRSLFKKKGS